MTTPAQLFAATTIFVAALAFGSAAHAQTPAYTYTPTTEDQQAIATCAGDRPSMAVLDSCVLRQAHQIASSGYGLTAWSAHPSQFEAMLRTALNQCGTDNPAGPEPTRDEQQCLRPQLRQITEAITDGLAGYAASLL
jgi:hypothetical protein